jgi:ABC-type bacteriocin/lantibiotic exporter with double-glycine peptidase domain
MLKYLTFDNEKFAKSIIKTIVNCIVYILILVVVFLLNGEPTVIDYAILLLLCMILTNQELRWS